MPGMFSRPRPSRRMPRSTAAIVLALAVLAIPRAAIPQALADAEEAWVPWAPFAEDRPGPWAPSEPEPPPEEDAREVEPPLARLPAVEPDPAVAPIVRDAPVERPTPVEPQERRGLAIRTVLALAALVLLAYSATHPAVERLERRVGISQVVTAGLPFLFLGMAARHPAIGVLSDEMLAHLSPVVGISLGWIGFIVGFRLDARALANVDERTVASAALLTSLPFLGVFVAASTLLVGGAPGSLSDSLADPVLLRDALILATAASMTAATTTALLSDRASPEAVARASMIVRLEELAGIAGLALVAAYFRTETPDLTWRLPGTAWLMVTVGAGAILGFLIFALVRRADSAADFSVLAIGSVAFAAGLASYLHLSSVVVCFVAAVLLANFPGAHQERLGVALARMERPIYLLLLVILGALWPTGSSLGWALIPAFAGARLVMRAVAAWTARSAQLLDLGPLESRTLAIAPIGSLAIAIVVNAQLLYPSDSIRGAVVAVVGGALITEVLVQAARRREPGAQRDA